MAEAAPRQIFRDGEADRAFRPRRVLGRAAIYGLLILWTLVCLFPIFWTVTTSFKAAPDVMKGNLIPFLDFTPNWRGWQSLGLSPDTLGTDSVGETIVGQYAERFPDPADLEVRIAMQRENSLDTVHDTRRAGIQRTAGHDFLSRLEQHSNADREFGGSKCEGRTEHDRGVGVVSARMRDSRDSGRERQIREFLQR